MARLPRRRDPDLERKVALVDALDLPWQVPTSLSEVDEGVLQAFIPGTAHPHGVGDPKVLAEIVTVFDSYDTSGLALNVPFAQRGRFTPTMLSNLGKVVPDQMAWAIAEHVHGWTDDHVGAGWCTGIWQGTICTGSTVSSSGFWIGIMRPVGTLHSMRRI